MTSHSLASRSITSAWVMVSMAKEIGVANQGLDVLGNGLSTGHR